MLILLIQLILLGVCIAVIGYMGLISYMVYRGCNYIPTPPADIATALSVLQKGDTFIDLGFGRGEVLLAALNRGAKRVIGYELDPIRFLTTRWKLRSFSRKTQLHFADIWTADLSNADVVFTFFTIAHMPALYVKAKREMKKNSWFVCYVHPVGIVKPTKTIGKVYFYRL